jgi:hypothetical protein
MTNTENNSSLKIEKSTAEIATIDQLAQSLAGHTRLISDEIIMPALKQSREYKPIIGNCDFLFWSFVFWSFEFL